MAVGLNLFVLSKAGKLSSVIALMVPPQFRDDGITI